MAHAYVEVFLGTRWYAFDPTGISAPIRRPPRGLVAQPHGCQTADPVGAGLAPVGRPIVPDHDQRRIHPLHRTSKELGDRDVVDVADLVHVGEAGADVAGQVVGRDEALAAEALKIFNERNIDDLIVVNAKKTPKTVRMTTIVIS